MSDSFLMGRRSRPGRFDIARSIFSKSCRLRRVTLRSLLWMGALAGLWACSAQPRDQSAWQGELASYVIDRHGRAEVEHRLRAPDGTVRPLIFPEPPALAPGTRMLIWGEPDGEAIRVRHHQVEGSPVQAL